MDTAACKEIDREKRRARFIACLDELDNADPPTPADLAAGQAHAEAILRWAAG